MRLTGQLMSESISTSPAFRVLVEGQGEFIQPPSDNYNLPLDPYQAARSFVMVCSYVDGMISFDYTWTKDGANFQPSTVGSISRRAGKFREV